MNLDKFSFQGEKLIEVQCKDRWQVFYRLQELEIPCKCSSYQPLQVQVGNPLAAVQLWSTLRQVNASHLVLVQWLENCWRSCNGKV